MYIRSYCNGAKLKNQKAPKFIKIVSESKSEHSASLGPNYSSLGHSFEILWPHKDIAIFDSF